MPVLVDSSRCLIRNSTKMILLRKRLMHDFGSRWIVGLFTHACNLTSMRFESVTQEWCRPCAVVVLWGCEVLPVQLDHKYLLHSHAGIESLTHGEALVPAE